MFHERGLGPVESGRTVHSENMGPSRRGGFPDVANRSPTSRSRRVAFVLRGNRVETALRYASTGGASSPPWWWWWWWWGSDSSRFPPSHSNLLSVSERGSHGQNEARDQTAEPSSSSDAKKWSDLDDDALVRLYCLRARFSPSKRRTDPTPPPPPHPPCPVSLPFS